MADISITTDDEYVSPDEFNNDELVRDLRSKINELSKQLERMKIEKDEAHRYIKDTSAKLYSHGELEKGVKLLTILNKDLESRLQAKDKAYEKLWKQKVSPTDTPRLQKMDTPKQHEEESNTTSSRFNEKTSKSQDKTVQQNLDVCVTDSADISELTERLRRKKDELQTNPMGRIHELDTEVKALQSRQQELLKSNNKFKKALEKLRDEKQALNEDTSRKIAKRENKICKTEENLRLMTTRNNQLEKDLEKAKEELDLMAKKLTEVHQEHDSRLVEDEITLSSKSESLEQQLDMLRRDLVTVTRYDELRALELKNEELEKLLKEKENIKETRDDELRVLELKNEELEKLLKEKENIKETRDDELRAMKLKNEELEKLLKEKENIKVTRDDELRALELKNEELEKLLKEKENIKETRDDELRAMKLEHEELEKLLKEKENIKVTRDDELRALELKNEELEKLLKEKENIKVTRDDELRALELKNEELEKLLKEKENIKETRDDELRAMKLEHEELEKLLKEKENIKVTRDDELRALELKNEELEKLLKEKENIKVTRDDDLRAMELKNEELEKSLKEKESIKDNLTDSHINSESLTVQPTNTRKMIEIRLRSVRSGMGRIMIEGVTKGLQKLLHDRLVREKLDLHFKPCQASDDVTEGPLFVLTLAKSIVGTKVNALEGIPGNTDTVLVVIHYTDTEESLSLTSIGFRTYGNELRQLGGTMDMAFSSGSGLYDCDVNTSAVERMTTFLKKY